MEGHYSYLGWQVELVEHIDVHHPAIVVKQIIGRKKHQKGQLHQNKIQIANFQH